MNAVNAVIETIAAENRQAIAKLNRMVLTARDGGELDPAELRATIDAVGTDIGEFQRAVVTERDRLDDQQIAAQEPSISPAVRAINDRRQERAQRFSELREELAKGEDADLREESALRVKSSQIQAAKMRLSRMPALGAAWSGPKPKPVYSADEGVRVEF